MFKTISSLTSSITTENSLGDASSSASNRIDATVVRVATPSLEILNSQLSNIKNFKYTYPKMGLYEFRENETWLTTAGRVALWAITFFTAGLIAGGLLTYDVFQNFKVESEQKKEICKTLDQLMSRICHMQSKISDMYREICGENIDGTSIEMRKMDTAVYDEEIDRHMWKEKTLKEHLEDLEHNKNLTHKEIYHEAIHLIDDQLQNAAKTCKLHVEELAQRVGVQFDDRMQKYNARMSSIQAAVDQLTDELKDASEQELPEHRRSLIRFKLIRAEANRLIETLEYVNGICEEIDNFAIQEGNRQFKNLADKQGKTLQEFENSLDEYQLKQKIIVGYRVLYIKVNTERLAKENPKVNQEEAYEMCARHLLVLPLKTSSPKLAINHFLFAK